MGPKNKKPRFNISKTMWSSFIVKIKSNLILEPLDSDVQVSKTKNSTSIQHKKEPHYFNLY